MIKIIIIINKEYLYGIEKRYCVNWKIYLKKVSKMKSEFNSSNWG